MCVSSTLEVSCHLITSILTRQLNLQKASGVFVLGRWSGGDNREGVNRDIEGQDTHTHTRTHLIVTDRRHMSEKRHISYSSHMLAAHSLGPAEKSTGPLLRFVP